MIAMLSPHFSMMTEEEFTSLPTSTNAVESHNRLSKHDRAEILSVALLTTYKIDMATVLEHMARNEGLSTSYIENSAEQRKKSCSAVRKCRQKRKAETENNDGPPDKQRDFQSSKYCSSGCYHLECNVVKLLLFTKFCMLLIAKFIYLCSPLYHNKCVYTQHGCGICNKYCNSCIGSRKVIVLVYLTLSLML